MSSCNAFAPLTAFDKSTDFSIYQSFSVCEAGSYFPEKYQAYDNMESRLLVNKKIKDQLVDKGYVVDDDSPDLLISYDLKFTNKTLTITQCRRENEYDYWEGCTLVEHPYTDGSLVLTAMDNSSNSIVWISSIEDAWTKIDDKKFEEKMELFIRYLLQDFSFSLE